MMLFVIIFRKNKYKYFIPVWWIGLIISYNWVKGDNIPLQKDTGFFFIGWFFFKYIFPIFIFALL